MKATLDGIPYQIVVDGANIICQNEVQDLLFENAIEVLKDWALEDFKENAPRKFWGNDYLITQNEKEYIQREENIVKYVLFYLKDAETIQHL